MAGPNPDGRSPSPRPRTRPSPSKRCSAAGRSWSAARASTTSRTSISSSRATSWSCSPGFPGSGKSSLAFDTIYAEGQRRYVESLSAYARQFLEMMQKPDVDQIDGLSPAIAIEQKTTSKNPRSTVGTVTEIHDYMRLLVGAGRHPLFARHRPADREPDGEPDGRPGAGAARAHPALSARAGRARPEGRVPQGNRRLHEARLPAAQDRRPVLRDCRRAGARQEAQARHRGRRRPHRRTARHGARASPRASRPRSSSPTAWRWSNSPTRPRARAKPRRILFSSKFACPVSGFTIAEIEPRLFSFNNPFGACPVCGGLGSELRVDDSLVVPNPKLALRQGAIAPWAKSSSPYYLQTLEALARHYKFRLDKPWSELPARGAPRDPARLGRGRDPLRL